MYLAPVLSTHDCRVAYKRIAARMRKNAADAKQIDPESLGAAVAVAARNTVKNCADVELKAIKLAHDAAADAEAAQREIDATAAADRIEKQRRGVN